MSSPEKIMIFIDHNNLFHCFQKLSLKYDYGKLKNVITQGRNCIATILYKGVLYTTNSRELAKVKGFENVINKLGIVYRRIFLKVNPNGSRQEKEIDLNLGVDIVAYAFKNCYDICVLVSGDRDYRPALEWVQKLNKKIEIWSFKKALSNILKQMVDKKSIFYLDNYLSKIIIK